MQLNDLTGQTFGRLTVIRRDELLTSQRVRWVCRCQCGAHISVRAHQLSDGDTQSCGCLAIELLRQRSVSHGMSTSPEYGVWASMLSRCTNPNQDNYARYGGNGISVDQSWACSFEAFYNDMGPRPSPEHSIERIDNEMGYKPGNCRWATRLEQANNKSNNVRHVFEGNALTLPEIARQINMNPSALASRVCQYGMSLSDAVKQPKRGTGVIEFNGRSQTLSQWAKEIGVTYKVLHNRIYTRGWSIERALTTT